MRLRLKRYRLHLRLVAVIAGGVAAGFVVTAWVPAAWAAALGGATTAVVTATVLGVQAELQRRSDSARRLPAALDVHSKENRFPLVRELSNPVSVGVHPAEAIELDGVINRVPFYIARDTEPELHAALRRTGFVLIVGESTAGKTRMAFEAMQLFLGNSYFVAPSSRDALAELLSQMTESGDYVMWLDDLERFWHRRADSFSSTSAARCSRPDCHPGYYA